MLRLQREITHLLIRNTSLLLNKIPSHLALIYARTVFFVLIVLYFVLYTYVTQVLGLDLMFTSLLKEIIFSLLILWTVYMYRQTLSTVFSASWLQAIYRCMAARLIWSVVYSIGIGQEWLQIISGLKYTIWPILLLVVGLTLGYIWSQDADSRMYLMSIHNSKKHSYMQYIVRAVVAFLSLGLILQCVKLFAPEFVSLLGYGPVGDYVLGSAPPLYYRTGAGGVMRLQGLFSGPNNFGYVLVAMFPVLLYVTRSLYIYHIRQKGLSTWMICMRSLFLISALWTLSRAVIIGVGLQSVLRVYIYMKEYRKKLIYIVIIGFIMFLVLSIYKRGSTVAHLEARRTGGSAFLQNMWGYGLGSSGPAVHRAGVYLPENQYLQYLLDTGRVGGVCLSVAMIVLIQQLYIYLSNDSNKHANMYDIVMACGLIMIGFLVIGLFLHVLEDSMVNYLVIFPVGCIFGLAISITNHTY